MNNIFVGQNDPLLNNSSIFRVPENQINPQILYQQMYANSQRDWLGELDEMTKNLDTDVIAELSGNTEYVELSSALQTSIQSEIMSYVKGNMNMNPTVVNNVKKQMEIISKAKASKEAENRQNMCELNDYMKNYSHLTFDEYKKAKKGEPKQTKKNNKETTDTK